MKRLVLAALLCSIPSLVLAQITKEDIAMSGCRAITEEFMQGMEALDAKAVAQTYAEDAVMGEAGQDECVKGRAAIQAYYQSMFDATASIALSDWVDDYSFRGTYMVNVGHCMVTMTMKDGATSVMRADFTDVRQPDSKGRWVYVNDFVAFTPVEASQDE